MASEDAVAVNFLEILNQGSVEKKQTSSAQEPSRRTNLGKSVPGIILAEEAGRVVMGAAAMAATAMTAVKPWEIISDTLLTAAAEREKFISRLRRSGLQQDSIQELPSSKGMQQLPEILQQQGSLVISSDDYNTKGKSTKESTINSSSSCSPGLHVLPTTSPPPPSPWDRHSTTTNPVMSSSMSISPLEWFYNQMSALQQDQLQKKKQPEEDTTAGLQQQQQPNFSSNNRHDQAPTAASLTTSIVQADAASNTSSHTDHHDQAERITDDDEDEDDDDDDAPEAAQPSHSMIQAAAVDTAPQLQQLSVLIPDNNMTHDQLPAQPPVTPDLAAAAAAAAGFGSPLPVLQQQEQQQQHFRSTAILNAATTVATASARDSINHDKAMDHTSQQKQQQQHHVDRNVQTSSLFTRPGAAVATPHQVGGALGAVQPRPTAQLTIFYAGMVHAYDDVPLDKMQAIMLLAGSRNTKSSSYTNHPGSGGAAAAVRPGFSAPIITPQSRTPSSLVPSTTQAPTTKATTAGPSSSSSPILTRPITRNVHVATVELPQARKASLARFLEKRKDRVRTKAPYPITFVTKSKERSSSIP